MASRTLTEEGSKVTPPDDWRGETSNYQFKDRSANLQSLLNSHLVTKFEESAHIPKTKKALTKKALLLLSTI